MSKHLKEVSELVISYLGEECSRQGSTCRSRRWALLGTFQEQGRDWCAGGEGLRARESKAWLKRKP